MQCALLLDSLGEASVILLAPLGDKVDDSTGLLPGTLDLPILKAVSFGTAHGYGVLLRIQITGAALQIQQGCGPW